jgi:uncharacterized protein (TIGR02118 family)
MFTVVFLVKKKPSMTQEEFTRYWIDEHTPFTSKVPGVRFYRCYPSAGYPGDQPPFDAVAVLGFDDEPAWRRAEASLEFAAAIGDAQKFQDTTATMAFFSDERVIV